MGSATYTIGATGGEYSYEVITYWFTYEKAGLATDTPHQAFNF